MPQMDGVAATKKIRSLGGVIKRIPIVAITANAMHGDRERYLDAGMTAYVPKPIDQRDLLNTITQLMEMEMPAINPTATTPDNQVTTLGGSARVGK